MRSLIVFAALAVAMPFKSVPDEAAVAELLGTFPVLAADRRTFSRSIPNSKAQIWATFT